MKPTNKVICGYPFGTGVIERLDIDNGKSKFWIVKLDNCPDEFQDTHNKQGGLVFCENELTVIGG
jgi:hypothetical protein